MVIMFAQIGGEIFVALAILALIIPAAITGVVCGIKNVNISKKSVIGVLACTLVVSSLAVANAGNDSELLAMSTLLIYAFLFCLGITYVLRSSHPRLGLLLAGSSIAGVGIVVFGLGV